MPRCNLLLSCLACRNKETFCLSAGKTWHYPDDHLPSDLALIEKKLAVGFVTCHGSFEVDKPVMHRTRPNQAQAFPEMIAMNCRS